MQVFLLRHAEAVDETRALRDPYRHLTPHGREQARRLGDRLRWHDCIPDRVWTSPLVRAIQTAELVIAGMQHDAAGVAVEVALALAPDGAPREVAAALAELARQAPDAAVMVVGHEPALSALGSLLLATDLPPLGKAHAARIVDGALRWRFAWDAEAPVSGAIPVVR